MPSNAFASLKSSVDTILNQVYHGIVTIMKDHHKSGRINQQLAQQLVNKNHKALTMLEPLVHSSPVANENLEALVFVTRQAWLDSCLALLLGHSSSLTRILQDALDFSEKCAASTKAFQKERRLYEDCKSSLKSK